MYSTLPHITRPAYGEERRRYLTFFSRLSWPAIRANTVGLVRGAIALLLRAQFCFQTSASDNATC